MPRERLQFPDSWRPVSFRDLIEDPKSGTWGTDPRGTDEDVVCIRAADFDRERLKADANDAPLRWVPPVAVPDLRLRPGDIVLEKSGGGEHQPVGASVIFESSAVAVCSNFAARLRALPEVDPRYLNYVLATAYRHGVNVPAIQQTTGIQNLNLRQFLASPWAVPPTIEEQTRIAGSSPWRLGP